METNNNIPGYRKSRPERRSHNNAGHPYPTNVSNSGGYSRSQGNNNLRHPNRKSNGPLLGSGPGMSHKPPPKKVEKPAIPINWNKPRVYKNHNVNVSILRRDKKNKALPDLSGFTVNNICGEGVYGKVYKAKHNIYGDVALKKMVISEMELEKGFPITAIREIKLLKSIAHENILHCLDVAVGYLDKNNKKPENVPKDIFMVFPYMEYDLGKLLECRYEFCIGQIKGYFRQLLYGLHHLHLNHILHRDMKPANILINNKGILKIADFGLSRRYCDFDTFKPNMLTKDLITPLYRPIEILLGKTDYNSKADMWGAGCILGEMFKGQSVFKLTGPSQPKSMRDAKAHTNFALMEQITMLCGYPTEDNYRGVSKLPNYNFFKWDQVPTPVRRVKEEFRSPHFKLHNELGIELIDELLALDPLKRLSAHQALDHRFFWEGSVPFTPIEMPALRYPQHPQQAYGQARRNQKRL